MGAGKDQKIYVVDRNNLGKFMGTDSIYQEMPSSLSGSVYSSPAWFNNALYYGASGDALKAFSFANGKFGTNPTSHPSSTFGSPGDDSFHLGQRNGERNLWMAENTNTAVLHAYDATNLSKELYNSNQAANGRDNSAPATSSSSRR